MGPYGLDYPAAVRDDTGRRVASRRRKTRDDSPCEMLEFKRQCHTGQDPSSLSCQLHARSIICVNESNSGPALTTSSTTNDLQQLVDGFDLCLIPWTLRCRSEQMCVFGLDSSWRTTACRTSHLSALLVYSASTAPYGHNSAVPT